MVFVVDRKKRALMPCSEKRARLLLERGRAVVHRRQPFTIRLKDRLVEASCLQPVVLKFDPGSRTTGLALVRVEASQSGEVHHALHLAELKHRGSEVVERGRKRAGYRRRRRSANLRYRAPRFDNRKRPEGCLAPSLRSRVGNIQSWVGRYRRWVPISGLGLELVKFDLQQLVNPEISGVEYQQGTLFGYEIRSYMLEKWGRRCAYCGAENVPFEVEHIVPRAKGGSNRISNLTLSCHRCNELKGSRDVREFLAHDPARLARLLTQAQAPLKDAATVNAIRWILFQKLKDTGLPVAIGTGGRTHWNRTRFGLVKSHAFDALCVGSVDSIEKASQPVLIIRATGRGQRCRTNVDSSGFPRSYRPRQKQVYGFQTGDLVRAEVPSGKKAGNHVGRVAVRSNGSFRVGKVDGISWRYCRLLQRADGFAYVASVRRPAISHRS